MYPKPSEIIKTENKTVQTCSTNGKKFVPSSTGSKSPEKEVNFSDIVTTVGNKQSSSPAGKPFKPATFPKPIIKKGLLVSSSDSKGGVIGTIGMIGMESDQESEADLYKKINNKDVSLESDCLDESILSPDEEDDDFKVHFVHHGKKENKMEQQSELLFQINELQEAVVLMKSSLNEAMTNLSMVDNGPSVTDLEEMKRKCDGNASEILKMVLSIKTDFSSLRNDVVSISKRQEILQNSLRLLLEDRRALASDLSQSGVISKDTRTRLDSSNSIIGAGGTGDQSESGSHSNDSGVALPDGKIPNGPFNDNSENVRFSGPRTSDQDSLPDQPSLLVPPSVYDYVAGLSDSGTPYSSHNYPSQYFDPESSLNVSDRRIYVKAKNERIYGRNEDTGNTYDSDSSLLVASPRVQGLSSNRNQDFSKTDIYSSASSSKPYSSISFETHNKDLPNGQHRESRASSVSRDRVSSSQSRRKKMLLGVSSTKLYQSTSHSHPTSGDRESRSGHRYTPKGDPREAQRYKIAKELLDTEKQYCRTLWTIQDTFAEPLKKEAILSNRDISTLFPDDVYHLYEKHCLLQHQLKERLASWKWQPLIGDILTRFTDPHQCEVLRLYTNYVNDFPEVLKTFHKLCHTSQTFTDFINKCLDQPNCRGMDLGTLLLSPVQRVPKYILILKYLLKYTDSSHPDYRSIYTVLERLRDFLARLNDAMEHSFRLVNSSATPQTKSYNGLTVISPGDKYSSLHKETRQMGNYESNNNPNDIYRSPKRSTSSVGGPACSKNALSVAPGRSASLPRGFTSVSSDSPDSSGDGQDSPPERRAPSRCGLPKSHSHDTTPYHSRTKYSTLTPARSATNVAVGSELSLKLWDELASSEPSLIDAKEPITRTLPKKTPSPVVQHPTATIATASTHKLVTWTDSVDATEDAKKKKGTIKSSIKNMFTFKRRGSDDPQKNGDEPIHWPSIPEPSKEISATTATRHIYGTTKSSPTTTTTFTMTSQGSPSVGDFLDEDGNPCSNV